MRDESGPAFPRPASEFTNRGETEQISPQDGMSLRDYFAGRAMGGLLAWSPPGSEYQYKPEEVAERAYAFADAMLRRRNAL